MAPALNGTATVIREVAIRYRRRGRQIPAPLREPDDVAQFVSGLIDGDAREHFVAIYLDGRHQPIAWNVVSVGTATSSLVHPRELFQAALYIGAVAVILAHNHPSGNAAPSDEDVAMTRRISRAGDIVGVRLVDHVIVGNGPGPSEHYAFSRGNPEALERGYQL